MWPIRSAQDSSLAEFFYLALTKKLTISFQKNIPPPKKKKVDFLGGGGRFLEYFHEFLSLVEIKNSGGTLELSGPYRPHFGRLSANIGRKPTIEISKIWLFWLFWPNLGTFFFKMMVWSKIDQKWLKMVLGSFFGS